MKRALEVLNQLVADGVIRDYAIGGAMGATFYLEPISTMDLDVFVLFADETDLAPLQPIYRALKSMEALRQAPTAWASVPETLRTPEMRVYWRECLMGCLYEVTACAGNECLHRIRRGRATDCSRNPPCRRGSHAIYTSSRPWGKRPPLRLRASGRRAEHCGLRPGAPGLRAALLHEGHPLPSSPGSHAWPRG